MQRSVSAREANQQFARILAGCGGRGGDPRDPPWPPVARIVPAQRPGERRLTAEQEAAHARSMERLRRAGISAAASSTATSSYDEILLDANVLVYAADRTAGERHERTLHILDRAARRDCVLTLQALGEFFT